jgi:hypothetical protein
LICWRSLDAAGIIDWPSARRQQRNGGIARNIDLDLFGG